MKSSNSIVQSSRTPRSIRGVGLIEVLISIFVLAVGAAALVTLHSVFFETSASSKANAEAMAIAQDRIEEMRNYLTTVDSQADFDALYADITDGNSTPVVGVNADFTRTETIAAAGGVRNVAVTVDWTDASGEAHDVTLDTELAFAPPYGSGLLAALGGPQSPYPTGRATLGEGLLPPEGERPEGYTLTTNGDGTQLYDALDGNLRLVGQGGTEIVLTLQDACQIIGVESTCTDFVTISGTVYIDTRRTPGEVFIQASNAAHCVRYYTDGNGDLQIIDDIDDEALSTTPDGDYEYFQYTCYIGGGWRGNIGMLLSGGIGQKDKTCMGDPNVSTGDNKPAIALRRSYSGLIYELPVVGNKKYSSYGIADAAVLNGHDFLLAELGVNDVDGSACTTAGKALKRPDSNVNGTLGDLFAGNPGDFFCLNDGYLDVYDANEFAADLTCAVDSSGADIDTYYISGAVTVPLLTYTTTLDLELLVVNTSDGAGNCTRQPFGPDGLLEYKSTYSCIVFDSVGGWNGNVSVSTAALANPNGLFCTPDMIALSAVDDDRYNNDFSCRTANLARISGVVTLKGSAAYALESVTMTPTGGSVSGSCLVESELSYSCVTTDMGLLGSWSGTLNFTPTKNGEVCNNNASVPAVSSGKATFTNHTGSATLNISTSQKNKC